ncbi:MAG: gamma-glutamyltransferase [Myxococcota bacterium]|nr:gamma-glutamyltransferase [Myxococcota bacterium]
MAADHPLASAVGAAVLERGGSAADAGVATLLTLGVINPFASGLGGGGFCVYRDTKSKEVKALDFREWAPAKASRDMYIVKGKADSGLSRYGGLAVGIPGEPAGLHALHQAYGALPWKEVVQPAYEVAHRGFFVGDLLPKRLASKEDQLRVLPDFVQAFGDGEGWVEPRQLLKREDLARTLARLRDEGPDGYYKGPVAEAIAEAVKRSGGIMTTRDLASYKVTWREPLQSTYREDFTVYAMPTPSSGGIVIIEVLNILEGFDLASMGYTAPALHLIIEALKHAFADRATWLGDGDFVKVPVERLTSSAYADKLRDKIDRDKTKGVKSYGSTKPPKDDSGTTHVSILDTRGNMLACTSTVNTSFGSMVYVPEWGLILNNEMDDFSAQPGTPNAYGLIGNEQNAIAPGKRPLSSMSPTLVLKKGEPFMVAGGSGGPTIITGTLLALLRVIDFGMTPTEAVASPRFHHQWMPHKLYLEPGGEEVKAGLEAAGHAVDVRGAYNSIQIVVKTEQGWEAVSDPRKDGRPAAPGRP